MANEKLEKLQWIDSDYLKRVVEKAKELMDGYVYDDFEELFRDAEELLEDD